MRAAGLPDDAHPNALTAVVRPPNVPDKLQSATQTPVFEGPEAPWRFVSFIRLLGAPLATSTSQDASASADFPALTPLHHRPNGPEVHPLYAIRNPTTDPLTTPASTLRFISLPMRMR